jgi:hypothetical protein
MPELELDHIIEMPDYTLRSTVLDEDKRYRPRFAVYSTG